MKKISLLTGILFTAIAFSPVTWSAEKSLYVERDYSEIPPAPKHQSVVEADAKSIGCMSCHTSTDSKSMHESPGVVLGCVDCHGGDASVFGSVEA